MLYLHNRVLSTGVFTGLIELKGLYLKTATVYSCHPVCSPGDKVELVTP